MAESKLFPQAERIYRAALRAVEPGRLVLENLRREGDRLTVPGREYSLDRFRNVRLIAFGKAAAAMAGAAAGVLAERLSSGIVVTQGEPPVTRPGLTYLRGGHPLPDQSSVDAARAALDLAAHSGEDDLVLVLISGGGSALLCLPAEGVSLEEKRRVTNDLLRAGASIGEINVVRKHLSGIKGGRLAAAAYPAETAALVISDVVGNDLGSIASGPVSPDRSTYAEAADILRRYGLWQTAPAPVRKAIEDGGTGHRPETVKPGEPALERVHTVVIGENMTALRAAKKEAEGLGFETVIMTNEDQGDVRHAVKDYITFLDRLVCSLGPPLCFLAGGELTVKVTGRGKGGRNTEFALAALEEIEKGRLGGPPRMQEGPRPYFGDFLEKERAGPGRGRFPDWLIMSLGTDGIDGPTDAAGAWIDPTVFDEMRAAKVRPREFLAENDSYGFFEKTGRLLKIGPTGTNVMDLRIFLLSPA